MFTFFRRYAKKRNYVRPNIVKRKLNYKKGISNTKDKIQCTNMGKYSHF